jgi:ribonuclease PH
VVTTNFAAPTAAWIALAHTDSPRSMAARVAAVTIAITDSVQKLSAGTAMATGSGLG